MDAPSNIANSKKQVCFVCIMGQERSVALASMTEDRALSEKLGDRIKATYIGATWLKTGSARRPKAMERLQRSDLIITIDDFLSSAVVKEVPDVKPKIITVQALINKDVALTGWEDIPPIFPDVWSNLIALLKLKTDQL